MEPGALVGENERLLILCREKKWAKIFKTINTKEI